MFKVTNFEASITSYSNQKRMVYKNVISIMIQGFQYFLSQPVLHDLQEVLFFIKSEQFS